MICATGFVFGEKIGIVTIVAALFGAPILKLMVKIFKLPQRKVTVLTCV